MSSFKNSYYPRIAVTVDMIAAGTDIKPLECLLFMRDVRSKNYFEQMKGRGTRTIAYRDLHEVTPSAIETKTHYVLIDAVGVTKSVKTDSRSFERKPTVSLKDLMMSIVLGARDNDTLTSLAGRLIKLDMVLDDKEKDIATKLLGVGGIITIARNMLDAFDEDVIDEQAHIKFDIPKDKVATKEQLLETQESLIEIAINPIHDPKLREFIEHARSSHDQIIDNDNVDTLVFAGWDSQQEEKALETIQTFKAFIEKNKNEIEALNIIYTQSYRNRPLTFKMIKEMYEIMCKSPYKLRKEELWYAYSITQPDKVGQTNIVNKLVDIISLIRYELKQTSKLNLFSIDIDKKFKDWIFAKNAGYKQYTEEQMEWLRMIKDHIATSAQITKNDFAYGQLVDKGGLGKFYDLFGDEYENIINEMNYKLIA